MGRVDEREADRLRVLRDLQILDSEPEEAFDRLTALAAHIIGTPRAAVSLVDESREWFKSAYGAHRREGPRDEAFCSITIEGHDCLVVEDASRDPRFADFEQVREDGIRFYAGAPVRAANGQAIGTLCVRDTSPRTCSEDEATALRDLALVVSYMIEARHKALVLEEALTARLEAERETAEADRVGRRLALAVEQADEAIVIYDPSGRATYVNPGFCALSGYAPADAQGMKHGAVSTGLDLDIENEELRAAFLQGRAWAGSIVCRRMDGTPYEAETSLSPINGADGAVEAWVEVRRDTTERRELENQLQQAQRLEAIGQLAAGIAHEINTPTQYVGDNTRFLKDGFGDLSVAMAAARTAIGSATDAGVGPDDVKVVAEAFKEADLDYLLDEIPSAIDQSIEGIERISTIVAAMKAFSHPATDMVGADLCELISSTVVIASSAWKYVADLELDIDPELPPTPCVPGEINQVVLNLIVNAAHAIEGKTGGSGEKGTIRIRAFPEDDYAVIEVSDTGGGIPPDILDRVFDPFFTTKEVGKGTGQGLFIAHDVVAKKHGGVLTVDSSPGKGTTFTIKLPLVAETAGASS